METGTIEYRYVCEAMGCEDVQNKFCGFSFVCPFCGIGAMRLQESDEDN